MRTILLALLLALLLATPSASFADILPRATGSLEIPFRVSDAHTATTLMRCDPELRRAYQASGLPSGDDLDTIRRIDRFIRAKVRYRADPGPDVWSNFARSALGGVRSVGDCEDYALTAVTLALCAGVPEERLGIALADEDRGVRDVRKINHAVAYYHDGTRVHAFADTSRRSVGEIRPERDRIAAWQTVREMRDDPRLFIPAIPLPLAGEIAVR